MRNGFRFSLGLGVWFLSGTHLASAAGLSLNDYLEQVKAQNHQALGFKETSSAAILRSDEGDLAVVPQIFASAQWQADAKLPSIPLLDYDRLDTYVYNVGISETTRFGLQAKLSYNVQYTSYVNPSLVLGGGPSALAGFSTTFYDTTPILQLTQSLWSNGFGKSTEAQITAARAQALAEGHLSNYQFTSVLVQAETAYWQLALARQTVEVEKGALDRAKKILDYNTKRAQVGLADKSDAIQAQANYELRALELQSALDSARTSALSFNIERENPTDVVAEDLKDVAWDKLENEALPARADFREDVKAALEQEKASEANAEISLQKDLPTFDIVASAALNGRADTIGDGLGDPFAAHRPTESIGFRFSAPLDISLIQRSRRGWEKEKEGLRLSYEQKVFEQEQNWKDLVEKVAEARKRLGLARQVEEIQRSKLENEKQRLRSGRSTTYQVLLFEQDFDSAQLNRIRAQADIVTTIAQMKLFGGANS
jgi:outer membrane protein TolC